MEGRALTSAQRKWKESGVNVSSKRKMKAKWWRGTETDSRGTCTVRTSNRFFSCISTHWQHCVTRTVYSSLYSSTEYCWHWVDGRSDRSSEGQIGTKFVHVWSWQFDRANLRYSWPQKVTGHVTMPRLSHVSGYFLWPRVITTCQRPCKQGDFTPDSASRHVQPGGAA